MRNGILFVLLGLSFNSFAVSLPCAEIFPKPVENGCQFEGCGDRIQAKVLKKTFLLAEPSTTAEKIQPLTRDEPAFSKLDYKFQWVRIGMVRALRDFTAFGGKVSWKKGDEFGYIEQEKEGLAYTACIGKERVPFQELHLAAEECPVGGAVCLGMLSYPEIKVWAHVKLKSGRIGWIDTDDLAIAE